MCTAWLKGTAAQKQVPGEGTTCLISIPRYSQGYPREATRWGRLKLLQLLHLRSDGQWEGPVLFGPHRAFFFPRNLKPRFKMPESSHKNYLYSLDAKTFSCPRSMSLPMRARAREVREDQHFKWGLWFALCQRQVRDHMPHTTTYMLLTLS